MGIPISGVVNSAAPAALATMPVADSTSSVHQEPSAVRRTSVETPKPKIDIEETARDLEKISLAFNKKLRFSVNRELEEVVVKVIDPETDKVIRELPPEEIQNLHLKMREMIGLLFDESA